MRDENRNKQIDSIKAEVHAKYEDRIRAAASREEKQILEAACEAEIAERIAPLLRDAELDAPGCL